MGILSRPAASAMPPPARNATPYQIDREDFNLRLFVLRSERASRLTGITDESLWFTQSGSDLLIQGIGSSDQIKVDNWFGTNGAALSEIKLSDGNMLDAQLNQLVSAMATFAVSNPSFNPATATQMPNDPSLQSTIAAAWHP